MSALPESLDVVLNELRVRLYHAARARNVPDVERLAWMIETLAAELAVKDKED